MNEEKFELFKANRRVAKKLLKQRLKGKMFHDSSKGTYIITTKRRFEK